MPCLGQAWRMLHRQVVLSQLGFAECVRPSPQHRRCWVVLRVLSDERYELEQIQMSSTGTDDLISEHLGSFTSLESPSLSEKWEDC